MQDGEIQYFEKGVKSSTSNNRNQQALIGEGLKGDVRNYSYR
jgi:hypothetical protein